MLRALVKRLRRWLQRRDYVTETTRRRIAWRLIERELQRSLDGPDDAEALIAAVDQPTEQVPVVFACSGCSVQLRIAVHPSVKDRLHRAWDEIHGQHGASPTRSLRNAP